MGLEPTISTLARSYSTNWTTFAPLWPRDYHTFLLPILCTGNPTTCAILRTPSILGLMHHLHDLTFLWLYAPCSWGKITLSLNVSNMSKNHLFLCCLNFLSFRLTSIYNRRHTKLNTLTKLFCDFFVIRSFSNIYMKTLLLSLNWSEEWDSNPRSWPWKGLILPTELPSHLEEVMSHPPPQHILISL